MFCNVYYFIYSLVMRPGLDIIGEILQHCQCAAVLYIRAMSRIYFLQLFFMKL